MGILHLEFTPAFPNGLDSSTQISRLAASESELYMLDAKRSKVLQASHNGHSLSLDNAFNCRPGTYSGYQVGRLVDILALPKNPLNATVLGIDVSGNLLYCAPGQVPQAIPLPKLPNTNWGKITSFALERGDLYVLDAESRALFNLYLQDIPSTQRLEISHTLNRSAAQIELIKKYINGRVRPSIASAKLQQSQYGLHSLMLHDIYSRLDQLQGDFDGVRKMVGPPLDKDIGSIPNMLQSSLTKVQDDLLEGIERLNGHKPDSETK